MVWIWDLLWVKKGKTICGSVVRPGKTPTAYRTCFQVFYFGFWDTWGLQLLGFQVILAKGAQNPKDLFPISLLIHMIKQSGLTVLLWIFQCRGVSWILFRCDTNAQQQLGYELNVLNLQDFTLREERACRGQHWPAPWECCWGLWWSSCSQRDMEKCTRCRRSRTLGWRHWRDTSSWSSTGTETWGESNKRTRLELQSQTTGRLYPQIYGTFWNSFPVRQMIEEIFVGGTSPPASSSFC